MRYNLFCDTCKKEVTVSTRQAIKEVDAKKGTIIHFECPACKEEITAQFLYKTRG